VKITTLKSGYDVIVDDSDYEILSDYKWNLSGGLYAVRFEKGKQILMHRQIMDAPKGMVVDHINGNKLDNRRKNLRVCTNQQNICNMKSKNNSGFKGVYFDRCSKKYTARVNKKHLGTFKSAEEAARVYDKHAYEIYGEFAYLNFPDDLKL
jgi:hypothetical protein